MINYEFSNLFEESSSDKQIEISFNENTITNSILSNDFSIKESLCDSESILFGSCESSSISFKIRNVEEVPALKGKTIFVKLILEGHTENPLEIGTYRINSDEPTDDKNYRTIKGYDFLYDILNTDYSEWYNSILPSENTVITLKQFRDSFFEYVGISQLETDLINDDILISRNESIANGNAIGSMLLKSICEINGVFGHLTRDNHFAYIKLLNTSVKDITNYMSPLKYEDYLCKSITCVKIVNNENDFATIIGEGTTYQVENNLFCFDKTTKQLENIGSKLLNVIKSITYIPVKDLKTVGNPCLEVGDCITIKGSKDIKTYILEREISGIQGMRDKYSAKGTEEPVINLNSYASQISQIMPNVRVIVEKTLDGIEVEVIKEVQKKLDVGGVNLINNSRYLLGMYIGTH